MRVGGVGDRRLEGEELEETPDEEGIGVKLPHVIEHGTAEARALLEGLIEHGEIAEGDLMAEGAPAHPRQGRTSRAEGEEPGEQLRGTQFGGKAGVLDAQFRTQGLEGGVEVVAEAEEADFGGGFARGEQPIVIPGAAFVGGGAQAPVM